MPDIFDASRDVVNSTESNENSHLKDDSPEHSERHHFDTSEFDQEKSFYRAPDDPTLNQESEQEPRQEDNHPSGKNKHRPHRPVEEYSEVMRAESPSRNPLDAFAPRPLKVFFDTQEKSEEVILLLRKHPITQLKWVLIALVLIFMPLLFASIGFFDFLPSRFQFAGLILWYLLVTGFVLESFLTWFFNVYIITDERIIDVDFLSLIYKNITAAKIEKLEDVTAETGGAIRSIYNFGTVKMQTAGANPELEFEDVPQPAKVTRLLNELLLEEELEKIEGRVN